MMLQNKIYGMGHCPITLTQPVQWLRFRSYFLFDDYNGDNQIKYKYTLRILKNTVAF